MDSRRGYHVEQDNWELEFIVEADGISMVFREHLMEIITRQILFLYTILT